MKRLLIAIVLTMVCVTTSYAEEDTAITAQENNTVTMGDLVGKTILYTWRTGPFKGASHILLIVDPNTMRLSIESGMKMTDPKTIRFDVVQVSDQVVYITWRSEEYAQTVVMTFNFKTNMIYEVAVTEKANYLSQGPFILKN
ncbi:hypothetical protein [Halodesulfovibrio aestuarii]|uniref:Uncharacterized protein n=1 Tax=Halodesulfovibrio aestuarii TaxID=126333 RepID=A0A8G2CBY2_9BACT|nr:hypothetical protein [Halodesulfovibrio aestuarii]SHJ67458.1 hypothetical protein SAMN05660830_02982 [Halodesulfovibrio aestuarii]